MQMGGMVVECQAMKGRDLRLLTLTGDARRGYTYFVNGTPESGYHWMLVAPNGDTLCMSVVFDSRNDCLKSLRAVRRHAASMHVIDESVVATEISA